MLGLSFFLFWNRLDILLSRDSILRPKESALFTRMISSFISVQILEAGTFFLKYCMKSKRNSSWICLLSSPSFLSFLEEQMDLCWCLLWSGSGGCCSQGCAWSSQRFALADAWVERTLVLVCTRFSCWRICWCSSWCGCIRLWRWTPSELCSGSLGLARFLKSHCELVGLFSVKSLDSWFLRNTSDVWVLDCFFLMSFSVFRSVFSEPWWRDFLLLMKERGIYLQLSLHKCVDSL